MSKIIKTPSNSPIMGRIDTLVNELCPEGVEMVTLGSLGKFENIGVDKKSIENEEDVVLLNYTDVYHHKFINSSIPSMIVTASDKKRLACNVLKGDIFVTPTSETVDDIGHSSVITEDINNCVYSYHIMRYRLDTHNMVTSFYINYMFDLNIVKQQILKKAQGLTRFGLSKDKFASIEIPLPPLSIQQEIVSVLDSFTTLIDKMKQEVEKRKKQMEYYREKLLTFEDGECEWKLIGSFTKVFSASRVHKNEWKNSGVPFWRSSDVMSFHNGVENSRGKAYISHELYERLSAKSGKIHKGDLLVTGGGSIGMPYLVPDDTPLYVKDADLLCIVANNVVNNKFLYKYMMSNQFREYLKRITHDASIPHYTISQIKETPVPVISLSLQEEIVSTLDKFESYITKLEKMIVLRQKQYEYYREQLLTFRPSPSLP